MQGVLFGLFKDLATAEKAHQALLDGGIAPESASIHRQDVPIAGADEERQGKAHAKDDKGLFSGLVHSLFDSGGEMDDSARTGSVRQALHRGDYAVSVNAHSDIEMAMAEKIFTTHGAVLQLHEGS